MTTPLEFIIRTLLTFTEDGKWNVIRAWKDLTVLRHKPTNAIIGVCGTNRGRTGFNGCGIAYVSAASDSLMFTDIPKAELVQTMETLITNKMVKVVHDDIVLALLQQWLAEFKIVKTSVEIVVGDTPQFTAIEAMARPGTNTVSNAEMPGAAPSVAAVDTVLPSETAITVNTNAKKRKATETAELPQKRTVGRPPAKLDDFVPK